MLSSCRRDSRKLLCLQRLTVGSVHRTRELAACCAGVKIQTLHSNHTHTVREVLSLFILPQTYVWSHFLQPVAPRRKASTNSHGSVGPDRALTDSRWKRIEDYRDDLQPGDKCCSIVEDYPHMASAL